MESSNAARESDVRQLQDECLAASDKLRQLQAQLDWVKSGGGGDKADMARMQQYYEEEIRMLREQLANAPRNFTDKSVSLPEYQDMRLKLEKMEIELSHRTNELHATQQRATTSDEQLKDMKRHFTIMKESNSAKEAQMQLLQSDVEALRNKLETKQETIEQKQSTLSAHQQDIGKLNGQMADLQEQMKVKDAKLAMHVRKIQGLEEALNEKEQHVENLQQRLHSAPHVREQKQLQDQADESGREVERQKVCGTLLQSMALPDFREKCKCNVNSSNRSA